MKNYQSVRVYHCDVQCKSVKAEFIREFYSWFLADDQERILSVMDDDIVWELVGDVTFEGIDAVREFLSRRPTGEGAPQMTEARVDGILIQGLWDCSFGTTAMNNGDSFAFNDVIRFSAGNALKIDKMRSYLIRLNAGS